MCSLYLYNGEFLSVFEDTQKAMFKLNVHTHDTRYNNTGLFSHIHTHTHTHIQVHHKNKKMNNRMRNTPKHF